MSACLQPRRSTLHHSGARSMVLFGQVRSVSCKGRLGLYLLLGIDFGATELGGMPAIMPAFRHPLLRGRVVRRGFSGSGAVGTAPSADGGGIPGSGSAHSRYRG